MSAETLTPEQFLKLDKAGINALFEEALPPVTEEDSFDPAPYNPLQNETLKQMKAWKIAYGEKANERRIILNWVIPVLLVGPTVVSMIIGGGITYWTAFIASAGTMLIVATLWLLGKGWRWEKKKYADNVEHAEKAIERIRNRRAAAWAAQRYDLKEQFIEWAEFSNFYIEGRGYRWKEATEGRFVVADADTGEELPRLTEAE